MGFASLQSLTSGSGLGQLSSTSVRPANVGRTSSRTRPPHSDGWASLLGHAASSTAPFRPARFEIRLEFETGRLSCDFVPLRRLQPTSPHTPVCQHRLRCHSGRLATTSAACSSFDPAELYSATPLGFVVARLPKITDLRTIVARAAVLGHSP